MMRDPINSYVCSLIRRVRVQKGLRVADMAERTGIPLGSYSCLETGRYRMSLENLFRVLTALQIKITDVWPGTPEFSDGQIDQDFIETQVDKAMDKLAPLLTVDDVIAAICRAFKTTPEKLRSSGRTRHLADARAIAAQLVKDAPHLSLVRLSRALNRDVSSLSHSLRRNRYRFAEDEGFTRQFEIAKNELSRQRKSRNGGQNS